MDGLSGAASVIAVFGLALSSTQVIYNTVSGIRNGPKAIQQMVSSLQDLSKILQQLTRCSDQPYLVADLDELAGRCIRDLKAFEQQLAKLSSSGANTAVTLWRNVKVMLQEKDLERMSTLIQRHVAALSLQMQIIER